MHRPCDAMRELVHQKHNRRKKARTKRAGDSRENLTMLGCESQGNDCQHKGKRYNIEYDLYRVSFHGSPLVGGGKPNIVRFPVLGVSPIPSRCRPLRKMHLADNP